MHALMVGGPLSGTVRPFPGQPPVIKAADGRGSVVYYRTTFQVLGVEVPVYVLSGMSEGEARWSFIEHMFSTHGQYLLGELLR